MTMQEMYEEIVRLHLPNQPASPQEIEEFERRAGWRLDEDMRAFPNPEYCRQVASSFSEFLEKALRSEGFQFWLD